MKPRPTDTLARIRASLEPSELEVRRARSRFRAAMRRKRQLQRAAAA